MVAMKYNFDAAVDDAKERLQLLIPNVDCIAWKDYSDKGTPCYNPMVFSTTSELYDDAFWLGAVKAAMPYGSKTHELLAPKVASQLGCCWVTYDWLIKAISRVFNGCDYDEFEGMIDFSRTVIDSMKRKGLKQIRSIEEALS